MKIGIPCQLVEEVTKRNGTVKLESIKGALIGKMQVSQWFKYKEQGIHEEKLFAKLEQNLDALLFQLGVISKFPTTARMLRISSELFPLRDFPDVTPTYDKPKFKQLVNKKLIEAGDIIKEFGIRVSVHPSQWITLYSTNDETVDKSEIHIQQWIDSFRQMGIGPLENGVCIVLHTNGQRKELRHYEPVFKRWLVFENDEKQAGFIKTLKECQKEGIRMVVDVHHYYCENKMHFGLNSDEMYAVLATWNGKGRPKMHWSSSRGTKNFRELCSHADYISEEDMERWWEFAYKFDIMVEAKAKNLAAHIVHQYVLDKTGL